MIQYLTYIKKKKKIILKKVQKAQRRKKKMKYKKINAKTILPLKKKLRLNLITMMMMKRKTIQTTKVTSMMTNSYVMIHQTALISTLAAQSKKKFWDHPK